MVFFPFASQIPTPFLSLGWYTSFHSLIAFWVSMRLPCVCTRACVCVHARAQLCLILRNPKDCSPPGSPSMYFPSKILECIAISSSRGSNQPRDWAHVSYLGRWFSITEPSGKTQPPIHLQFCLSLVNLSCINLIIRLKNLERKKRKCFHPYSSEVGSTCFHSYFPSSIANREARGIFLK